ncbi:OBAP family protein [Roseomonas elaeocarpi]|uniref:OBAP family protein n=1 Tax=Roseomonas elaeocarpi TaxID=907779 RepID=A0ABV6JYQ5_9PROT
MSLLHSLTCRRCFSGSLMATAVAAPLATLFGTRGAKAQNRPEAPPPGDPLSTRSHVLDTGADALQRKAPLDAMSAYLNGFHFYADDMGRQVEASHYCTHLTEDFHQCVIFSSNQPDAKLIGIEYIVSEKVFRSLPEDEKKLWHSHDYEVRSGELVAPGLPDIAEHALMKDLVTTYGKTWHTWQIDRDPAFPMGIPQLMMGFTADGQITQGMLDDRDKRFDLSFMAQRKNREDIAAPQPVAGANTWQSGTVPQLKLEQVPVRNRRT